MVLADHARSVPTVPLFRIWDRFTHKLCCYHIALYDYMSEKNHDDDDDDDDDVDVDVDVVVDHDEKVKDDEEEDQ